MARKSAFDRLASTAARIDKLQREAGTLAGRMLRTSNPAKLEAQSKAGRALDRRIRNASKQFREIERGLLRTTPGQRKRIAESERQAAEARLREEQETKLRVPGVVQTFTIRGSYHNKRNHGISLEIKLTYVGLPLDEKKDAAKIKNAVRALARGERPDGFEIALVEYGPTVERRVPRGRGDFQLIKDAVSDEKFVLGVDEP